MLPQPCDAKGGYWGGRKHLFGLVVPWRCRGCWHREVSASLLGSSLCSPVLVCSERGSVQSLQRRSECRHGGGRRRRMGGSESIAQQQSQRGCVNSKQNRSLGCSELVAKWICGSVMGSNSVSSDAGAQAQLGFKPLPSRCSAVRCSPLCPALRVGRGAACRGCSERRGHGDSCSARIPTRGVCFVSIVTPVWHLWYGWGVNPCTAFAALLCTGGGLGLHCSLLHCSLLHCFAVGEG